MKQTVYEMFWKSVNNHPDAWTIANRMFRVAQDEKGEGEMCGI